MHDNTIYYEYGHKTILELRNLQEDGHLNLNPGFQRKSVWTASDRQKLDPVDLGRLPHAFGFPLPTRGGWHANL